MEVDEEELLLFAVGNNTGTLPLPPRKIIQALSMMYTAMLVQTVAFCGVQQCFQSKPAFPHCPSARILRFPSYETDAVSRDASKNETRKL